MIIEVVAVMAPEATAIVVAMAITVTAMVVTVGMYAIMDTDGMVRVMAVTIPGMAVYAAGGQYQYGGGQSDADGGFSESDWSHDGLRKSGKTLIGSLD